MIVEIRQRVAVVLFCHFCRFRMVRLLVAPAHLQQGFHALPAFGAVQFAQAMVNPGKDFAIVARFPRCVLAFPVPLQPATGVGDRAIFFGKAGRRQAEDFGLNRGRIDIIRLAVVLPEGRGLGHQRIDNHHIFQLTETADHFVFVREGRNRVEALADIAGDVAVIHHIEILDNVVGLIPFRQPVEAPVILFLRRIAVERFHQADEEFRVVAPVVHLVGQRRFRRVGAKITLQIALFIGRQRQITRQTGRQQAQIGQPLNIGVAAQRVDAAAGHAHIAEQQLDHRHGADVLRADGVLRPAQGIQEGGGAVRGAG